MDDVVLFVRPSRSDLRLVKDILECFGHVSGLGCNLSKSSAAPIQCSADDLAIISGELTCSVTNFPCTYLGLPLTIKKPTKSDLLPLVGKVADKLPGWKAPLLSRAGQLVVVKVVLTATPIHLMTALDLPKWVFKSIDKIRRNFLWKGQEQAKGGNCLVSWTRVQRPLMYGGLGVHDLERLGWALRIRWLWLQKTDDSRPWKGLPVNVPMKARARFDAAVVTTVGNGVSTKFWTDRWIQGKTVAELAPNLLKAIPKKLVRQRTVRQALLNRVWVTDIQGALMVQVLSEYLLIWEIVDGVTLQPGVQDQHLWKFSSTGSYSCKSAYAAMFFGTIKFTHWKRVWRSWAPSNCKFFVWLAINNRCWTSDRLAKRGLPHHAACPFCDQEESIHHILLSCVLTREVWESVLRMLRLDMVPRATSSSRFGSWWSKTSAVVPKDLRKGFNSLFILVTWEVWKHRNACTFEGAHPLTQTVLGRVAEEGYLWCSAGASKLQELLLRSTAAP
ncbi:hypothetical protein U9M48_019263 [Paspalum notatum var. saurae]|uniref:Reverse transcriptase zinc-binding domain-containing protein n=1 Tax=Paspalum notatum var. saurae TaxID=547442 RepID=A0AAQ3TEY3_PASNO